MQNNNVKKEPWYSSSEKERTLKLEDFGTSEDIWKTAEMSRMANNRRDAEIALENIISANGTVKRSSVELKSKSGLSAFLRRSSIGKLVSGIQEKGMPKEVLWQAVANIDKLFSNAIEPWRFELNPNKNNDGLKSRRILYAPAKFGERVIPIKITVKEYFDPQTAAKLYSIEAVDFDLNKKKEDVGALTAISL